MLWHGNCLTCNTNLCQAEKQHVNCCVCALKLGWENFHLDACEFCKASPAAVGKSFYGNCFRCNTNICKADEYLNCCVCAQELGWKFFDAQACDVCRGVKVCVVDQ